MLKRLRSAHPMLYCLVAEVLFLGMLFVASLLSLLLILFVVRDIDAVDDYMLTFMQEAAGVLVAWLFLARTGKSMSELLEMIYEITGRLYSMEESIPATPEMRLEVPRRLESEPLTHIGEYKIVDIVHTDGTKILLENDNWALLRFSGTEPVLRLFVEADTPDKAEELLSWLRGFVTA